MKPVRIIPRLDVKGANLVKGVHMEGLRVIGRPERFASSYYQDGADELLYIDAVASLYGRNNLEEIVKRTAEDVFIPITVGGGIRSIGDIRRLLNAGADKVAINTAAIRNPEIITEGAKVFGSQCIVVSIQAMRVGKGKYEPYTDNGREPTGMRVAEWVRQAVDLGAGEILITSIDQEGTGNGFDLELFSEVIESVPVPVIACGGAGKAKHFEEVIKDCNVDAVSASSIFHYNAILKIGVEKCEEGNIEYLKKFVEVNDSSILKKLEPISVSDLKSYLRNVGVKSIDLSLAKSGVNNEFTVKSGKVRSKTIQKFVKVSTCVALVDYGRSNLFSVEAALKKVGANVIIARNHKEIMSADKLVIAGVGAFGDGMKGMKDNDLINPIKEFVATGKPVLGICLGMQLFMSEGEEFGIYEGLDLIKGRVVRLKEAGVNTKKIKIPHVGWSYLFPPNNNGTPQTSEHSDIWQKEAILRGILEGSYVYFIHSNVVLPDDKDLIIAEAVYGNNNICTVIRKGNIVGCQFHPERSGEVGLKIYSNFVSNFQ